MFETFGNKVKIKSSPETEKKGLAGQVGEIYGETTPSIIDIEIIGTPKSDYAVNVHIDILGSSFWFDPDLLEKIDDGQGTVVTLYGIDKKWTKAEDGEWIEENTAATNSETKPIQKTSKPDRKWWKFWED